MHLSDYCFSNVTNCHVFVLILFKMDLFGNTHGHTPLLPKICHTYPILMKLRTLIRKEDLKEDPGNT